MNRDQKTEHPIWVGNYLKLEKKREFETKARRISAQETFAPTASLPKQGEFRTIEPIKVGSRGTLGWEGLRQSGSDSDPLRQCTTTSAVLFLKCS